MLDDKTVLKPCGLAFGKMWYHRDRLILFRDEWSFFFNSIIFQFLYNQIELEIHNNSPVILLHHLYHHRPDYDG